MPSAGAGPTIIAAGIVILVIGLAWLNHAGDEPRGGTAAPLAHGQLPDEQAGEEEIPASQPASPLSLAPFFEASSDGSRVATSEPTTSSTGPSTTGSAAGQGDTSGKTGDPVTDPGSGGTTSSTQGPSTSAPGTTTATTAPPTTRPTLTTPTLPPTTATTAPPTTDTTAPPTTDTTASTGVLDALGNVLGGLVDALI